MVVQTKREVELIAHLMRRAGFGATRDELEQYAASGYDEVVERLLNPTDVKTIPDELIRRYHHEQSGMMGQFNPGAYWLYKMITTSAPLQEKMIKFMERELDDVDEADRWKYGDTDDELDDDDD